MARYAMATMELGMISLFVGLALLIDYLGWRCMPRFFKRFDSLSYDDQRRVILRLSTAPPKILYIWAPCLLLCYTDEAIRHNTDNIQSVVKSTW